MQKMLFYALLPFLLGSHTLMASTLSFEGAYQQITEADLRQATKTLSSDEFEGRQPTSTGETRTLDYLTRKFKALGYQPGNGKSYQQGVNLLKIIADPKVSLTIGQSQYTYKEDMVVGSARETATNSLKNSELVFVGYGVNAPEYGWNDYEGIDVTGKTVVILVNDPGFVNPEGDKFQGKTMTYYGRWTYKYEEASRQGAAGALIVHETAPASYGWSVVANSWSGPQYHLVTENGNQDRVAVEGWLSVEATTKVFKEAGFDYQQLKAQANTGPMSKPLGIHASVTVKNTLVRSLSNNFIATLPGSKKPNEHIIYTAHWDHLGKDAGLNGDKIYNGAHDNATGTAGLLSIAKAFGQLKQRPERSLTFLIVTAEEQGLLGSKYYAEHPVVPLDRTVANLNIDAMNILGKTKDIAVVGFGKSELENYLTKAAKRQGRYLKQEDAPQAGYYYRSDHFSFAKKGVPALYAKGGGEAVDDATATYRKKMSVILRGCYHQVCDQYRDSWNFGGIVEDTQLFFEVGYDIANSQDWPKWHKTSEFQRR